MRRRTLSAVLVMVVEGYLYYRYAQPGLPQLMGTRAAESVG